MQQSTACLHFAWRTTSLRVGGRAARRSHLRRGGGGRQAGAAVVTCLVWLCELAFRLRVNRNYENEAASHFPTYFTYQAPTSIALYMVTAPREKLLIVIRRRPVRNWTRRTISSLFLCRKLRLFLEKSTKLLPPELHFLTPICIKSFVCLASPQTPLGELIDSAPQTP